MPPRWRKRTSAYYRLTNVRNGEADVFTMRDGHLGRVFRADALIGPEKWIAYDAQDNAVGHGFTRHAAAMLLVNR